MVAEAAAAAAGTSVVSDTGPLATETYTRAVVSIPSTDGSLLDAWLYLPASRQQQTTASPLPIVLMGHGMGAQKDMGLHQYACAFVEGGLAALVFDYRTFGGSGGQPRQWVSPARHCQDWQSAVDYVKQQLPRQVDVSRMCLWGTSFAGGHVLVTAANNPGNVVAVVSQVPHLDARAATRMSIKKRGIPKSLACLCLGLLDRLSTAVGLPPVYLPLVGPVGSLAFMQLNDFETREYFSKHPTVYQGGWTNKARAALVLELFVHKYSPIQRVPDIHCPILFVAATQDVLCPVDQVHKAVGLAQQGQLLSRECTHFELYRGALFEGLIGEQTQFLRQKTGLAPSPGAVGGSSSGAAELLRESS